MSRPWIKRHKGYLVFMTVLTLIAIAAIAVIYNLARFNEHNGKLRDATIAVRAAEATKATNGIVTVRPSGSGNLYRWNPAAGHVTVPIIIGSCNDAYGFVTMPEAPKSVAEVGELIIIVPSVNENQGSAEIAASDPTLIDKLLASGYAHCIANDPHITK